MLDAIGLCEVLKFFRTVLWSVVGNQLGRDAMFCEDALQVSDYGL